MYKIQHYNLALRVGFDFSHVVWGTNYHHVTPEKICNQNIKIKMQQFNKIIKQIVCNYLIDINKITTIWNITKIQLNWQFCLSTVSNN